MRVLGIDPGLRFTGYACVEQVPASLRLRPGAEIKLLEAGVIRLKARESVADRLVELDADLRDVLARWTPQVVAVEKLYAHHEFTTTAAIMGHARGVILLAARQAGAELMELSANEVKKAIAGYGHADKRQMQDAVMVQLGLAERPEPPDVADAIGIALCAARRSQGEFAGSPGK